MRLPLTRVQAPFPAALLLQGPCPAASAHGPVPPHTACLQTRDPQHLSGLGPVPPALSHPACSFVGCHEVVGGKLRLSQEAFFNLPPQFPSWASLRLPGGCVCVQSCLILCQPMDYSPSGSSVHGILQARILDWVAIPSSRGSNPGSKEEASFNFMAAVTICSDFGAQKNKV